jgi:hypothetical protein
MGPALPERTAMAETSAGQEARLRWPISWIPSPVRKNPMPWVIAFFVVVAVILFGIRWFVQGERASFAQDFFAVCLDGIVFAGFVKYLEGRDVLLGQVRLKSHAIWLLLAELSDDERRTTREALSEGQRSRGAYEPSRDVLNAFCSSLGVWTEQATGTPSHSGLDIQVLIGMLPVAAELSGQHLTAWRKIIESVKAYRAALGTPASQTAIPSLRSALKAFLGAEVFTS